MPIIVPSPREELDALTVINRSILHKFIVLSFVVWSHGMMPDVFSQADKVPCIMIASLQEDGTFEAVAKGYIEQPTSTTFHFQPMDPNCFKVSIACALPGHKDGSLPFPPDEEPTMRIGQSKGWHLLWLKSHLCLENITPEVTPTNVPVHR